MRLSALNVFPVKSCAGISLQQSIVTPWGLDFDRQWLIVDPSGNFQSQRGLAKLALVQPSLVDSLWPTLRLSAPGMATIVLPLFRYLDRRATQTLAWAASLPSMNVTVWNSQLTALVHQAASQWISQFTGRDLRMVCFDPRLELAVPQPPAPLAPMAYAATTLFSDGYPFLLIGQATLDDLNAQLQERHHLPVDMRRFRPNLVVDGFVSGQEDVSSKLTIGSLGMDIVKPCSRCSIPNVDPDTAETGVEPGDTLALTRRGDSGDVYFGQNLILDIETARRCDAEPMTLRVGDAVSLN